MLLQEFFGKSLNLKQDSSDKDDDTKMHDELFWFIIDHDKLHKDYFIPLAVKYKKALAKGNDSKEKVISEFMPMVEKGCKEFYQDKKMNGKLGKLFPQELRDEMCERLYDHFCDDIRKDQYKLGQ